MMQTKHILRAAEFLRDLVAREVITVAALTYLPLPGKIMLALTCVCTVRLGGAISRRTAVVVCVSICVYFPCWDCGTF